MPVRERISLPSIADIRSSSRKPESGPIGIPSADAAEKLHQMMEEQRLASSRRLGQLVAENTVLRRANGELQEARVTDSRTGLLNRDGLVQTFDAMRQIMEEDPAQRMVFLFLDADKFKDVNTHHGYAGGDEVIAAMGARLQLHRDEALRQSDVIGRWGGDEFVVLALAPADGLTDQTVESMKDRLRASVEGPVALKTGDVDVRISGGGAILTKEEIDLGFDDLVTYVKESLDADKAARRLSSQVSQ